MSQAANHSEVPAAGTARRTGRAVVRPFAGLIDAVLVEDPVTFPFAGSVARSHAQAGWTWVYRDLCPDLISADGIANGHIAARDVEAVMPELLARMKKALAMIAQDPEKD